MYIDVNYKRHSLLTAYCNCRDNWHTFGYFSVTALLLVHSCFDNLCCFNAVVLSASDRKTTASDANSVTTAVPVYLLLILVS